ncbi:hypothetical protein CRE_26314 [Caenorhabditis remanei]|uniref:Kringle-like domain-containing protein n=1 Tax=Caenorhabditis remanei TaxID=31234 RepID=E3LRA8_CAERE|nr:hypothetical protein CRE_26314 [Caenorhabditis remanei]
MLIPILFLIKISSGVLYDGKFFDPKDRIRAECIVKKVMSEYEYLGNHDKSIDGEACVPWIEVTESWFSTASNAEKQMKQPAENFHHSKCRNLKLPIGHAMRNVSAIGTVKTHEITNGAQGPWCFINKIGRDGKSSFSYSPSVCFDPCDETKIVSEKEKKRVTENEYTVLKLNYNPTLLDPIEKLFSGYEFGDMKYYTFKKSREQPPQYLILRRRVFTALCIIFIAVMIWILTCFCVRKHSQKIHRKKEKALEGFYESTNLANIKMQAELRRERDDA